MSLTLLESNISHSQTLIQDPGADIRTTVLNTTMVYNKGDVIIGWLVHPVDRFKTRADEIHVVFHDPTQENDYKILKRRINMKYQNCNTTKFVASPTKILPGFHCVVYHCSKFHRAQVISLPRIDMVKCVLLDSKDRTEVLIHFIYILILEKDFSYLSPRLHKFRLHGLSEFNDSTQLVRILQNQIDWNTCLSLKIITPGTIPEVICKSSTYPNVTVNEVILKYLFESNNPILSQNTNKNLNVRREFSSLYNWRIPYRGNNWGTETYHVFDLVPGIKFFGKIIRFGSPGIFVIVPSQQNTQVLSQITVSEEKMEPLIPADLHCGCLLDGYSFIHDNGTEPLQRCKVLDRTIPDDDFEDFGIELDHVRVKVMLLDIQEEREVPTFQLKKLTRNTSSFPVQAAIVHWILKNGAGIEYKWNLQEWKHFSRFISGHTLHMELIRIDVNELKGQVNMDVHVLNGNTDTYLDSRDNFWKPASFFAKQ